MTLREIWNYLQILPDDAPLTIVMNGGQPRLTSTDYLLMDVYEAITRRRHPRRPLTAEEKAKIAAELAEQERRKKVVKDRFELNKQRRRAVEPVTEGGGAGCR